MQATYKRYEDGKTFELELECYNTKTQFWVCKDRAMGVNFYEFGEIKAYGITTFKSLKANTDNGLTLTDENGKVLFKAEYRDLDVGAGELLPIGWETMEKYKNFDREYLGCEYMITTINGKDCSDDPLRAEFLDSIDAYRIVKTLAKYINQGVIPEPEALGF